MKESERQKCLQELSETLRRLGPYRQMTNGEPFRVNDAVLAELLSDVVMVLHFVVSEFEGSPEPRPSQIPSTGVGLPSFLVARRQER